MSRSFHCQNARIYVLGHFAGYASEDSLVHSISTTELITEVRVCFSGVLHRLTNIVVQFTVGWSYWVATVCFDKVCQLVTMVQEVDCLL